MTSTSTAPAAVTACCGDTSGADEDDPYATGPHAFREQSNDRDSGLQAALRGAPRDGEDWQTQEPYEVLVDRIRTQGFLVAHTNHLPLYGFDITLIATGDLTHGVVGDIPRHRSQSGLWLERLDVAPGHDPTDMSVPREVRDRLDMLNLMIDFLDTHTLAPTSFITSGLNWDNIHYRLWAIAAVDLWWQQRMTLGYTPEAAQMLLAMSAHPTVTAHLTFTADHSPVFTDT